MWTSKKHSRNLYLPLALTMGALGVVIASLYVGAGDAAAPNGPALSLDGVDDYATAADSPSLDLGVSGDFTAETFFFVPDLANQSTDTLIWKQGAYGVYFIFNAGSQDRIIFRIWTGFSSYNFIYADVDLLVGWHHMAAVFDNEYTPDSDLMALYMDGSLVSSSTAFEWTPGIPGTSSVLNLGAYVGVNPFKGWLDESRLSSSVRYSGNSYSVPSTAFTSDADTTALWHFDETAGSTVFADASGNGNALTAQNGAATGNPPGTPTPTRSPTPSPSPAPSGKGDVNCDGIVNEDDMLALLRHVAGVGDSIASQPAGDPCLPIGSDTGDGLQGDVNCDGLTDVRDALYVLLFRAGLPLDLPVGCEGP